MKGKWTIMVSILVMLLLVLAVGLARAQEPQPPAEGVQPQGGVGIQANLGTAFTYQGQLKKNGSPVNGNCDFQFSLWDAAGSGSPPTGGNLIGSPQTKTGIAVINGLFTAQLDFGAGAFQGDARWLQIAVKCTGDVSYNTLSPRQLLTPAPYALALPGLWTQQNNVSPNLIGGYGGNSMDADVVGSNISGGGSKNHINYITDNYSTIGGGSENTAGNDDGISDNASFATIGGGENNISSEWASTVSGGQFNKASNTNAAVGGGSWNIASGENSTISGGLQNKANGNSATIGGGAYNDVNNKCATIGGGYFNSAYGQSATISGGDSNNASGSYATISGGYKNIANGDQYATIGGGNNNIASGIASTVGGGWDNMATGDTAATIGGGMSNIAGGEFSTIPGGFNATATHYGEMAYASGSFTSQGDAQTSIYVLRNTSSGTTTSELFLDGSGSSARLTIASGRTVTFDILVVGREDSNGESAGYHILGVIENVGGNTAIVGSATVTVLGEDDTSWYVTVDADVTNQALRIQVHGGVGDTVRWVATVRTAEVSW